MPSIVKTVYLLRRKSCAWFGFNLSIFLLCQVKNPDEINTRHVNLLHVLPTLARFLYVNLKSKPSVTNTILRCRLRKWANGGKYMLCENNSFSSLIHIQYMYMLQENILKTKTCKLTKSHWHLHINEMT